ncbi:hypothetical protein [Streptomyces scabiei]|uniref:Uncharacterized protein n=1 Tax=Streptomyces scabiei TaxID=1930 RepID=A0A117EF39_STRSC|nr:hypothetical protein [Streptomyces scabiei]GAQ65060.1 hypothetical protein SsS58_05467 [Streptomyces scabiei]
MTVDIVREATMDNNHPMRPTDRERRGRSGMLGRHFPRSGTEPITAQSALRLRLVLSGLFLPALCAAAYSPLWAADTSPEDSPGRGLLVSR